MAQRSRVTLGPDQPVGAVLDLAGDQGAPQNSPARTAGTAAAGWPGCAPEALPNCSLSVPQPSSGATSSGWPPRRQAQAQVVEGGVQLAAGRDQEQRHRHQGDGRGQGLLAVLAPDQPGHACTSSRSLAAAAARKRPRRRVGQVGEHQVLQGDAADGQRRVAHRAVGADQQGALAVGAGGPDHRGHPGDPVRVAAGPTSSLCRSSRSSTGLEQLHPGRLEHDQVVADPLQVGQQVRRQQHGQALLGDVAHHGLEELAPGQGRGWPPARPAAAARAAWPGPWPAPPGPAGRLRAGRPCGPGGRRGGPAGRGQGLVEAAVERGAQPQQLGPGEVAVQGASSATKPTLASRSASFPGVWPRRPGCCRRSPPAARRPGAAGWSCRRRWGRPGRRSAPWAAPGCSPAGPRCAGSACPARWPPGRGTRATPSSEEAQGGLEQGDHVLGLEAGRAGLAEPGQQLLAELDLAAQGRAGQRAEHEGALARAGPRPGRRAPARGRP